MRSFRCFSIASGFIIEIMEKALKASEKRMAANHPVDKIR